MEQFPGEQKEEAPVRNLKTHPVDTIRAIAEVEGPEWFAQQEDTVEQGIYSALQRLNEGKPSVIYGRYGMNRWHVKQDGAVVFSESHAASPDHLARVRELGFDIIS
jgi:hypothetical protein